MQQVRASGYYLIYKRYKRANFRLHRPLYNHGDNHPCSGFGGGGGGNERVRTRAGVNYCARAKKIQESPCIAMRLYEENTESSFVPFLHRYTKPQCKL